VRLQSFGCAISLGTITENECKVNDLRVAEPGLEQIGIEISPSLAGYMRHEKKRAALRSTPFPCYESSPDDITECILSGMILKCRETIAIGRA